MKANDDTNATVQFCGGGVKVMHLQHNRSVVNGCAYVQ